MFYVWLFDLIDSSGFQIYSMDSPTVDLTFWMLAKGSGVNPEDFQRFDPEHTLLNPYE